VLNTPNILLDCCVCFKKKEKDDTTQAEDAADEIVLKISSSPKKMDLTKPNQKKQTEKKPNNPKDHWVDKSSRALFPSLYALFLLGYSIYYKSKIVD